MSEVGVMSEVGLMSVLICAGRISFEEEVQFDRVAVA